MSLKGFGSGVGWEGGGDSGRGFGRRWEWGGERLGEGRGEGGR
jgi:hypothetical protein